MKIFITILLILILALSLSFALDESAMLLHDKAFERAMVAFGLAKGLNAVISLIQGTELSFAPVGIGLNFSIGEVLDPFNDMVERFSWVMLAASISLGVQKLLLVLSSKIFLQVVFTVSIGVSLIFIWMKKLHNSSFFVFSMKILLLLIVLRFGAILSVYTSELLYDEVLYEEYEASSAVLEKTKSNLDNIHTKNKNIMNSKKESAWYQLDVTSKYNDIKEQLNLSAKLEAISQSIEDASRKIITLITIFVIQSIVMPLLFLWFFIVSIKLIFRIKLENERVALFLK